MKKRFAILLALLLCLTLCSCFDDLPAESFGPTGGSAPTSAPTTIPEESGTPITVPTQDSKPIPSEPVHCHSWQDATCTEPAVCTDCGETKGSALGHDWKAATCDQAKVCNVCGTTEGDAAGHTWSDATCTAPKTCKTCGASEGKALGHSYKNDSCTRCGAADPDAEEMVWIPTNGGTKYHTHSGCSNMKNPKQVPLSEAVAQGFTPCKRCH